MATRPEIKRSYTQPLARPLVESAPALVAVHWRYIFLFLVLPLATLVSVFLWYYAMVPATDSLRKLPMAGGAFRLDAAALCESGAFSEQRLLWGASVALLLTIAIALYCYTLCSMRPYFASALQLAGIAALFILVAAILITTLASGERTYPYRTVFGEDFIKLLAGASELCMKDAIVLSVGRAQWMVSFFDLFNATFHAFNALVVLPAMMVGACIALTIVNVSVERSDEEFLRKQRYRLRSFLYLTSLMLIVGVVMMQSWSRWPLVAMDVLKDGIERAQTSAEVTRAEEKLKLVTPKETTQEKPALDESTHEKQIAARADLLKAQLAESAHAVDQRRKSLQGVSTGFTVYFGAVYTLLLILMFVPAARILERIVRGRAMAEITELKSAKPDTDTTVDQWLKAKDMEVTVYDQIKPLIALLAPLFAGPLLEIIKGVPLA